MRPTVPRSCAVLTHTPHTRALTCCFTPDLRTRPSMQQAQTQGTCCVKSVGPAEPLHAAAPRALSLTAYTAWRPLSGPHSHASGPLVRQIPAPTSCLRASAPGAEPQPPPGISVSELIEWDIVEYMDVEGAGSQSGAGQHLRLGKVTKVDAAEVQLEPLVEEEEGVWVSDELFPQPVRVLPECVIRVVEAELGQRQDREHNPHGEHCHDIWQVTQLNPRVYRGGGVEASTRAQ